MPFLRKREFMLIVVHIFGGGGAHMFRVPSYFSHKIPGIFQVGMAILQVLVWTILTP